MIHETFAIGTSIVHQLDPRIRVAFAILYAFVVALSYRFSVLIAALILSALLIFIAQVSIKAVFKRMAAVNTLILLIWLKSR
jgi:cobalt/nickel transport system permease protein